MTISLQELCCFLDTLYESERFSDHCPNGLQIEGKPVVKKIVTAVSFSVETIKKAIAAEADVLIVHHGFFWKGDDATIFGSKRKKLELLIKNEISLIAFHLPMDAHRIIGNNWKAARDLGWQNLEPFGKVGNEFIGVIGNFAEIRVDQFQKQLEEYFSHIAHPALGGKKRVSRCALVSGGAYKLLIDAKKAGCDCFVTGNFDEPVWHQAFEESVNFFALGHSATERIGPMALAELLNDELTIPVSFVDVPNPF